MANLILNVIASGGTSTTMVSSVSDPLTGHVYSFSKPVQAGQYWNGEWFVVADPTATITSVTPNSVDDAGRIKHGMMVDPLQGQGRTGLQGFDSAPENGQTPRGVDQFDASLNIDPTINGPITLTEGSYVKAESIDTITVDTRIQQYSVLTVVPSAPAANSFRPGIRATSKASTYTTADVDWTLRNRITGFLPMGNDPSLGISRIKRLQRCWGAETEVGRGFFPFLGIDSYGNDWAGAFAARMLAFHGDYNQADIEDLTYTIIQVGIDILESAADGAVWPMEEGQIYFRKFQAMMAALLLNDAGWKALCNWNTNPSIFGSDDNSYYYVTQSIIDSLPYNYTREDYPLLYTAEHIGMPEWGSGVESDFSDGSNTPQIDSSYRNAVNARMIQGVAWSNATPGAAALSNPAMSDYMDRFAEILAGDYDSGLYDIRSVPTAGGSGDLNPVQLSRYQTTRSLSVRPVFVGVPEEMAPPSLTAETDGTVTVNPNATSPFLSPRATTSAIASYQLRWRPITNLTGTTTPDASVPWQVITDIPSLPYTLTGVPGGTDIRVQIRAVNAEGTGIWLDWSGAWNGGSTSQRTATTVTTHAADTAPQVIVDPTINLAVLGAGAVARCDTGIWVGRPSTTTFAFEWRRNGTPIPLAASQTYTVQAADEGTNLTCHVTATNTAGTTTFDTPARAIVASAADTYTPTISTSLFTPAWYYTSRIIGGSGFVYGYTGNANFTQADGVLRLNEVNGANFGHVENVDVYMEYELTTQDIAKATVILRGQGDSSEAGYELGYRRHTSAGNTETVVWEISNRTRTTLANNVRSGFGVQPNQRRSLRVQADGTNLRVREWLASDTEPVGWEVTATGAALGAGWVGPSIHRNVFRIYKFNLGFNGASAPTT